MREVTAYLCEHTEQIYTTVARARRSEFQALMKRAANSLPSGQPSNTMQEAISQLSHLLSPPTSYSAVLPQLREALDYLEQHMAEM